MSPEEIARESEWAQEWMDDADLDELMDSVVPTACPEGCEVEPDGVCPHGYRSPILLMGMI